MTEPLETTISEGHGSGLTKEEEARVKAEGVPGNLSTLRAASQNTGYPDYLADAFVAAHPSNYTAGRQGHSVKYLVVHVIQGSAASAISWFQNPNANVSAHYVMDETRAVQTVGEQNTTWANGNWMVNLESITIEHRGVYNDPNNWSDALLRKSARIAAGVIRRNPGILLVRSRIFGHGEIVNSSHPYCPGKFFPYDRYIALVREYLRVPAKPAPVKPSPPSGTLYRVQAGSFSDRANAQRLVDRLKKDGYDAYIDAS